MNPATNPVCGIWRRDKSRIRFRALDARPLQAGRLGVRPTGRNDREGISMSDFDRNYAAARSGVGADRAVAIDQGLRAYMIRVYNNMAVGVALTGIVAWLAYQAAGGDAIQLTGRGVVGATAFGQLILSFPGQIVLFLGTLGLVFMI